MSARELIRYPFPLSPEFVAVLNLPADLTPAEAERLCKAIQNLALPPSEDLPAVNDPKES